VVVIGIAGVVGVLLVSAGMATSLSRTVLSTGKVDRAIVLKDSATLELASELSKEDVLVISQAPGIARTATGEPLVSADSLTSAILTKKTDHSRTSVSIRGIGAGGFALRPELQLREGRKFVPGLHELIVGSRARAQLQGLEIGQKVALRGDEWTVVGAYESGDMLESGLLADAATLQAAYLRSGVNSVTVQLESRNALATLKRALSEDPTLAVTAIRETEYYLRQSRNMSALLSIVTYLIATIMAIGAIFAALNTLYSAVSRRTLEIATLRAIGFDASSVVISVLAESLLLSIAGALLGSSLAWLLFDGELISVGNVSSAVIFRLSLAAPLWVSGILLAVSIGLIGGLFPAIRAARLPVAAALRQS
jgi:putative ABC transport system permease protein